MIAGIGRARASGILLDPLFLAGLALRIALVAFVRPQPAIEWYVPFIEATSGHAVIDPWAVWLSHRGDPAAFPYGIVMWVVLLPAGLIAALLHGSALYGYGVSLMAADLAMLFLLRRLAPGPDRRLVSVYWLSPIVLVATYVLGYNDLVPVTLLVASLCCLRAAKLPVAGALLACAISAKLSMILALPFFGLYFLRNRAQRSYAPVFLSGLAAGLVLTMLPVLVSSAALQMILSNPEIEKIYDLNLDVGAVTRIDIVPLMYLLMLYAAWRVRRMNFALFHAVLGTSFLLIVLLTPASPGWFLWSMPLIATYQLQADRKATWLVAGFSALFVVNSLFALGFVGGLASLHRTIPSLDTAHVKSLVTTALFAAGVVLAARVWRDAVSRNDFFRLSRKPFVLGIAGDSGSGKDTLVDALSGLLGSHSVASISGDDYHLWDRQRPIWQVMTHLNPMANDLEGFANDVVALWDGKAIQSRHYNHKTGKMSRPREVRSNDVILVSGLHALYMPILRDVYNLSIYLAIDERLRRRFRIVRDVHVRGHAVERVLATLDAREPDAVRFIRPQAGHADLVLSLQPIHPHMLDDVTDTAMLRMKLVVQSRHGLNELALTRILVGVCGLQVDVVTGQDASEVGMTIEGETSAQDIELAARMLCPRIFEFLDVRPTWLDGPVGLMQLLTLAHINQALTKRLI